MSPLLDPVAEYITQDDKRTFKGMTTETIPPPTLLAVREDPLEHLQRGLGEGERRFLIPLVKNRPE